MSEEEKLEDLKRGRVPVITNKIETGGMLTREYEKVVLIKLPDTILLAMNHGNPMATFGMLEDVTFDLIGNMLIALKELGSEEAKGMLEQCFEGFQEPEEWREAHDNLYGDDGEEDRKI